MRNIIPLFLVMLMITTAFAAMDHQTLDEGSEIDNTSARSSPDMDVLAITTPSETTCVLEGCSDTLPVGQPTEFKAVIRNIGDADVTYMSYSVDIYLADSSGNRGMQATDSNGNPLSWTNEDFLCDANCKESGLAPNTILDNGQHTMTVKTPNGFEPITWTPIVGEYVVVISVDAEGDNDPGNDDEEIYVQVVDWQDVSVDLSWKGANGNDGPRVATGEGPHDFSLAVTTDGSVPFTVRNVTIKMEVNGAIITAQGDGGIDLLANSGNGNGITILTAGTSATVTTFQEQDDANNTTSGTRHILNYKDTWYFNGTITPDSSVTTGSYTIDAIMESYVIYGQLPECVRTEQSEDPEEPPQTFIDYCEATERGDDESRNNEDTITGSISNYHDIKVSMMTIAQGYNSDGTGNPDYFVNAGEDRDLRVGESYIQATVEHAGSNDGQLYDWNATFTVEVDGVSTTYESNSCESGVAPSYPHAYLGDGFQSTPIDETASFIGYACVQVSLQPGEYEFTVEVSIVDSDVFRGTDQKMANNIETMQLNVVNNAPTITSFSEYAGDALVVSQENPVELTVFAFDVDDINGEGLTYAWTWNGGILPCAEQVCSFQILPDYMNNMRVVVTVSDEFGAEASRFLDLEIWNDQVATATSDSGISIEYAVQFFSTSNFTVTASDVSASDFVDYEDVELPGFSGKYDAVAAVDFEPSNSYDGTAVLSQTLDVTVPKSLGATSMWYVIGNQWQLLDDSADDVDASTDVYSFALPDNTETLRGGDIVFMGGALEEPQLPDASITGFSITPILEAGGAFNISWSINGVVLDADRIDLKICEGSADCETPEYKTLENTKTSHVITASKVSHDSTYFVEVAICNAVGCSSPIGAGNITVDSQIDGGAEAGAVIIQENGDNWDVTWVTYGDLDDVDGWKVCWSTTNFDSTNMPTNCEKFEGSATEIASIPMPTAAGRQTYYFAVVPYDEFGNSGVSDADNSIEYYRAVNIEEPTANGTISDGSDGTGAGDLPGWALPAIGGVILVMVVIAAFILTRGGGGDNEGKDWDY